MTVVDHLSGSNVANQYLIVLYYQHAKMGKKFDSRMVVVFDQFQKEDEIARMQEKYGVSIQGITPYANLYHYDLPLALEQKYLGLLSDKVVKDFADFADFCFKTYGDRVKNWLTLNELRVVAALGYDNGIFAPGRCSKAMKGLHLKSTTKDYGLQ